MQLTMMATILGSILALVSAIVGWLINSIFGELKTLRETKADKKEVTDLKESINREILLQFENQNMQFKAQNQHFNFISACLKSMAKQSSLEIPDIQID